MKPLVRIASLWIWKILKTVSNNLAQVCVYLKATCFSLDIDHQAKNIQSLKARYKFSMQNIIMFYFASLETITFEKLIYFLHQVTRLRRKKTSSIVFLGKVSSNHNLYLSYTEVHSVTTEDR
jgi:hypothetical protein